MSETATIQEKVDDLLRASGVTFAVGYVGETVRDKTWRCDAWRFRLTKARATYEGDWFSGLGLREKSRFPESHALHRPGKPKAPRAADVLHSLLLDGEATHASFKDWCADFGSDEDSIKAWDMYRACCDVGENLRRVFTRQEIDALREATAEL